ncbi:hypothetical protein SAY87_017862 [Trapa incisa]|uniref:Uncharacterized protein n=1 Tax=Trapa incisa TaxID=236973 RepID=A0AAN7L348_9MYRT|nr:hypothetical protein SAY87_017862 [Trapa incisa]
MGARVASSPLRLSTQSVVPKSPSFLTPSVASAYLASSSSSSTRLTFSSTTVLAYPSVTVPLVPVPKEQTSLGDFTSVPEDYFCLEGADPSTSDSECGINFLAPTLMLHLMVYCDQEEEHQRSNCRYSHFSIFHSNPIILHQPPKVLSFTSSSVFAAMASLPTIGFNPAAGRVFAATAAKDAGGSKGEKSLLDWILGGLQKEEQLFETDPLLKKVEEKSGGSGTTSRGGKSSVAVPNKKKNGGFGGLFAKKE